MIRKNRLMTVRMDKNNLGKQKLLRRQYWLPTCVNMLTLIISNGVNCHYAQSVLSQFRSNIHLNIELENFNDEDTNAEKFMDLLSYYNI